MARRKERYCTTLEHHQCDRLRWLVATHRVPAAVILRDVLDRALDEWEQDRARTVPLAVEPDPRVPRGWVGDDE